MLIHVYAKESYKYGKLKNMAWKRLETYLPFRRFFVIMLVIKQSGKLIRFSWNFSSENCAVSILWNSLKKALNFISVHLFVQLKFSVFGLRQESKCLYATEICSNFSSLRAFWSQHATFTNTHMHKSNTAKENERTSIRIHSHAKYAHKRSATCRVQQNNLGQIIFFL